jgi:hypothetical protein
MPSEASRKNDDVVGDEKDPSLLWLQLHLVVCGRVAAAVETRSIWLLLLLLC